MSTTVRASRVKKIDAVWYNGYVSNKHLRLCIFSRSPVMIFWDI